MKNIIVSYNYIINCEKIIEVEDDFEWDENNLEDAITIDLESPVIEIDNRYFNSMDFDGIVSIDLCD